MEQQQQPTKREAGPSSEPQVTSDSEPWNFKENEVTFYVRDKTRGKYPVQMTPESAGYDLFMPEDVYLEAGEFKLVDLDIYVGLPKRYYGELVIRSSCCFHYGIVHAGGKGIIDGDYRNETLKIPLWNKSSEDRVIQKHERVAQLIIKRRSCIRAVNVENANDFPFTKFDDNNNFQHTGFGSTGK